MSQPGARALALHLMAHWLRQRGIPVLPGVLSQLNIILHGIDINPRALIAPTVHITHTVGIVIGAGAIIEDDCWLFPGVVLGGAGGRGDLDGDPHLMVGAAIGAGAKVLGRVTIGRGATIAANAVVLSDVPPGDLYGGIPARSLRSAAEK